MNYNDTIRKKDLHMRNTESYRLINLEVLLVVYMLTRIFVTNLILCTYIFWTSGFFICRISESHYETHGYFDLRSYDERELQNIQGKYNNASRYVDACSLPQNNKIDQWWLPCGLAGRRFHDLLSVKTYKLV